jgi:hypothetical protein
MEKYAEVDVSAFPVVKVVFTGASATAENFQVYLNEVQETYSSKQALAIVFDATKAVFPGLAFQKMQAKWLKDNEQLMKDYCKGTAYVIPNLVIRNVLSAIFAFQKQPITYKVCSNDNDADAWVRKQLDMPNASIKQS